MGPSRHSEQRVPEGRCPRESAKGSGAVKLSRQVLGMRERIEGEDQAKDARTPGSGGPERQAGVLGSVGDSAGTHHSTTLAVCSLGQEDPLNRGALAHWCIADVKSAGRNRHSSIRCCFSRKVADPGLPRTHSFSGPWPFRSGPDLGSVSGDTGPVGLVGTFALCD